jgi:DNA-binding MarR family transcriptional regulator
MDDINKKTLNAFFVNCFYTIMAEEERALESLSNGKLSLKEIHVIEAVFKAKAEGENENNFSGVAKILGITLGTLTASFSRLEKKGYLFKRRDEKDKRVYYIEPTRLATLINGEHTAFHQKMIEDIIENLSPDEIAHLTAALKTLDKFFSANHE